MKLERHAKIIELIGQYAIETQEELAERLNEAGFRVTQATVSRDIRELKLTKMSVEGRQRYVVLQGHDTRMDEKYVGILREGIVAIDMAQNILVIKTVVGMAQAVGVALDSMHWSEVVGCIAGDDTIFCAVRTLDETLIVTEKIRKVTQAR